MIDPQTPTPKEQKEILTQIEQASGLEKVPIVERKAEVGPEVKDWMQKLEEGEEIQLPQPVTDDAGQPIVQSAAPQQPKIILPLDEEEFLAGLKKTVKDSVRWLAEWCQRLLKMFPGKAGLRISK